MREETRLSFKHFIIIIQMLLFGTGHVRGLPTDGLTLPMLRLLSSKAQERKDFWKTSKPCHAGTHWIALAEYSHMSTHLPRFQSLSWVLHYSILAKLANSSIWVKLFIFVPGHVTGGLNWAYTLTPTYGVYKPIVGVAKCVVNLRCQIPEWISSWWHELGILVYLTLMLLVANLTSTK